MADLDLHIHLNPNDLIEVKMTYPSEKLTIKIGTLPTDVTIHLDKDAADDLLDQLKMFVGKDEIRSHYDR